MSSQRVDLLASGTVAAGGPGPASDVPDASMATLYLDVSAATVRDALTELERRHPGIAAKLLDGSGSVKPFIRIYVRAEDIGGQSGLDTAVGERDEIDIIPAIAGGADA